MAKEVEPTLGLPAPFPSSPKRPPSYNLKLENKTRGLFYVGAFCELYACKYVTDLVLASREWEWVNTKTIECEDGLTITSDSLEQIIEYEFKGKESKWVPPAPYFGQWHAIAAGQSISDAVQRKSRTSAGDTDAPEASTASEGTSSRKKRSSASSDVPSTPKQPKQRVAKDGLVTVAEIAEQLGLDPKACRIALRKSNTAKPDAGWAWPPGEVDAIKATIKKHAK